MNSSSHWAASLPVPVGRQAHTCCGARQEMKRLPAGSGPAQLGQVPGVRACPRKGYTAWCQCQRRADHGRCSAVSRQLP